MLRDLQIGTRFRTLSIVSIGIAAALGAQAQIQPRNGLEPPDLLELVGHVGKPLPGESGGWNLVLGDRYKDRTYHFHLARMRVLNSGRLPMNILAAVEPYRPNFFLFPDKPDLLAALERATAHQQVTVVGYRQRSSRNLLVSSIDVAPLPTPTVGTRSP